MLSGKFKGQRLPGGIRLNNVPRSGLMPQRSRKCSAPNIRLTLKMLREKIRIGLHSKLEEALLAMHSFHGSKSELIRNLLEVTRTLLGSFGAALWSVGENEPHIIDALQWPEGLSPDLRLGILTFAPGKYQVVTAPLCSPDLGERLVLAVSYDENNKYGKIQQLMLDSLGKHASVALKRLEIEGFYQKRTASLELMHYVTERFAATLNLQELFHAIYTEVGKVMTADIFFVAIYDRNEQEVNLAFIYEDGQAVAPVKFAINDGPTSRVIRTNTPLVLNIGTKKIPGALHFGNDKKNAQALLMAPIALKGQVLGVLSVQSYTSGAYADDDLMLLSTIANQSAIAVHNSQLYAHAMLLANTDGLTGLMNKRAFLTTLDARITQAKENGGILTLVMVDSDSLKTINETYGHFAGDEHLCNLAEILRSSVRDEDLVCRYGGDEFILLLGDTDAEQATIIATRIVERVRFAVHMVAGRTVHVTVSAGVAEYPLHAEDRVSLIAAADQATRDAKQLGKNRVSIVEARQ